MKYYLIVGEASGDLHAAHLMKALHRHDSQAEFRFFGGDLMTAEGGTRVRHIRETSYMGFVPVLLHLPQIVSNMRFCKRDIASWRPDAVILVDYPGFNLSIANYIHRRRIAPVFYYISPKIWAWKERRIKNIKRDVDRLFSILPFEVDFYEQKHHYPIHYVGNPTADEVREFQKEYNENFRQFASRWNLDPNRPVIALLAGSRRMEIKHNLAGMIAAARSLDGYQMVLAGAPTISQATYNRYLKGEDVKVVENETFALLSHASAALVTSGTATLETALFGVPQVVCYATPNPRLYSWLRRKLLKVPYVSLVNLIANYEVVPEFVAADFKVDDIQKKLYEILPGGVGRQTMLDGYAEVARRLGETKAPDEAARLMVASIKAKQAENTM